MDEIMISLCIRVPLGQRIIHSEQHHKMWKVVSTRYYSLCPKKKKIKFEGLKK